MGLAASLTMVVSDKKGGLLQFHDFPRICRSEETISKGGASTILRLSKTFRRRGKSGKNPVWPAGSGPGEGDSGMKLGNKGTSASGLIWATAVLPVSRPPLMRVALLIL
jgi:hypothetical protein